MDENQELKPQSTEEISRSKMKANSKNIGLIIMGIVILIALIGGTSWYVSANKKERLLDNEINQARELVLYNPLATGEKAQAIIKLLPQSGERLEMKYLRQRFTDKNLSKMISEAEKEIQENKDKQMEIQEKTFNDTKKLIEELKKDSHFPKKQLVEIDSLVTIIKQYLEAKDVVGMNIAVAGLQGIAGETTTFIQEKTEEQKKREEEEKQKAEEKKQLEEAESNALEQAIKDETYPSLGMLRGDLPNGGGVIPMFLMEDGPAYEAGFDTDSYWDNSSVVVAIDGIEVKSAVIGEYSMENALKKIKLGKRVEVTFKDGSTKDVELNLTHKKAKANKYPDLPDPGKETSTDLYFGISGYNIGKHNNNKEIGLVITDLYADGSAYSSDLVKGDIICRIDGYYVGDTSDIKRIISNRYEGSEVTVDYIDTNGDLQTTEVELLSSDK